MLWAASLKAILYDPQLLYSSGYQKERALTHVKKTLIE
uniref:Uncharacterized protein n=1 Tax=Anguilla anguilla TaxID=7936 RepID=A0A0E9Q574_ANGAN